MTALPLRTVKFQSLAASLDESAVYRQPYAKQFFQTPTLQAGVGARGSGKTYAFCLYDRFMFEHGYFTRMYYIGPTLLSNLIILENTPLREEDAYVDRNAGPEAITLIEQKVIQDVQWYEEVTEMYQPLYSRAETHGFFSLNKEERAFVLEFQPRIEAFYEAFLAGLRTVRFEAPCDQQVLDGMMPLPKTRGAFQTLHGEEEEALRDEDIMPYLFRPPAIPRPAPVLFIDDMSHTSIFGTSTSNPLVNLVLRHRHLGGAGYGVSIQFAVQTFKGGMQRAMRANTMQFLLFKTYAKGVLENIYEELGAFTTQEDFLAMYKFAVQGKHDFLLVDMNASSPDRVFRRNFEEFILPHTLPLHTGEGEAPEGQEDEATSVVGIVPAVIPTKRVKKEAFAQQVAPLTAKMKSREEVVPDALKDVAKRNHKKARIGER